MGYKTDTIALKVLMAENQINTIIDFAERTGLSRETLGKVLKGQSQPSTDTMYKIVEALNLPPSKAGEIFFAVDLRGA